MVHRTRDPTAPVRWPQAQSSSSRVQALADRAAALLLYLATGAGVRTFVAWSIFGTVTDVATSSDNLT